jgi:hypothetical protein
MPAMRDGAPAEPNRFKPIDPHEGTERLLY